MNYIKILLFALIVLFFIIFFYVIFTNNNKLIKYRVTKDYIKDPVNYDNYNDIKNKYLIETCKDVCKDSFCDEYQSQMIKYDLCKECKKQNKCYDYLDGICVPCENDYTCEQLYGCDKTPPINPVDNYCTRCWIK